MTPRFLTDENVNPDLAVAMRRRCVGIDILTHGAAGLLGKSDVEVVAFAQLNHRILISYDTKIQSLAQTTNHAGILLLRRGAMRTQIDDLKLIWEASDAGEWTNVVRWIPF